MIILKAEIDKKKQHFIKVNKKNIKRNEFRSK